MGPSCRAAGEKSANSRVGGVEIGKVGQVRSCRPGSLPFTGTAGRAHSGLYAGGYMITCAVDRSPEQLSGGWFERG